MREFFCYPILLRSNLTLRLFSIKFFTIYSIQIRNYSKSVSEQTIFVLFVTQNQKPCTISFTNALTQGDFGAILNLVGAFYQMNRFVFHCRMLYLVLYLSNALQLNYFIIIGKLFLWDCRRNQIKPKIKGYQNKIAKKYETERKTKKDYFENKWIFNPLTKEII